MPSHPPPHHRCRHIRRPITPTAAFAALSTIAIPAFMLPLPLDTTATRNSRPAALTRPMLLTSHNPVALRGNQPFLSAHRDPVEAAADTPQSWPAAMFPMSPWTYARESALSAESSSSPNTCRSSAI